MQDTTTGPGLEPAEIVSEPQGHTKADCAVRFDSAQARQNFGGFSATEKRMAARPRFDQSILSADDLETALVVLGWDKERPATLHIARAKLCEPSAVVQDEDGPIMYRWHVVPRNDFCCVYLHVQVRSDAITRGPHDHEYDSSSLILSGMYLDEKWALVPAWTETVRRGDIVRRIGDKIEHRGQLARVGTDTYRKGNIVERQAEQLHRIILPEGSPYSMSLFSAGSRRRKWGFGNQDGTWSAATAKGELVNGCLVANGRAAT